MSFDTMLILYAGNTYLRSILHGNYVFYADCVLIHLAITACILGYLTAMP